MHINLVYSILILLVLSGCSTPKIVKQEKMASIDSRISDLESIIADYKAHSDKENKKKTAWPNLSDSLRVSRLSFLQDIQQRLQSIDYDRLDTEDRLNKDMLNLIVNNDVYLLDFNNHQFPLNAEGGFLTSIVFSVRGDRIQTEEDYDEYIQKLRDLPPYFDQRIQDMRDGIAAGKVSPGIIIDNCIRIIDIYLENEKSFFLNPIQNSSFQSYEISEIIEQSINPAYSKLRTFLDTEYRQAAPIAVGISNITDGKAYYEQRVRYYTTLDMSPEEVFQTGETEVARIRAEMEAIIDKVNFDGTYADFLQFLRTDEQFYVKTGEELLAKAAWIAKQMENEMPKYFGKLPRMPFSVKPVPAAIAPTYTTGRYSSGSYKNNRAGQYWVNTYKLESRPLYVLPALTLHEAVPGHHHQGMLAQELEGLPDFRKQYISAFGEGWGLYSEYLGKEVGMYTTPYEDFGRLTYEMWRACRLVVDVGMHYKGWTRDQAIDFMATNTALSLHEVNTEIDRYIGWPAQAVSYKIGELKIRALRKLAEERLGDAFEIRAFHDKLLENGSLPLSSLEMIIMDYISEGEKGEK